MTIDAGATPLPEWATLTEEQLTQVFRDVQAALEVVRSREALNKATLLDPARIAAGLSKATTHIGKADAVLAMTNANLNAAFLAGPAPFLKDAARSRKAAWNQIARLLRVVGGALESTDVGSEA